jgi:hypothetical protein
VAQRGDDRRRAVAHAGRACYIQAAAFRVQRSGQLTPARRQLAQPLTRDHAGRHPLPGEQVGGKGQDQAGVDAVGLGGNGAAAAKGGQAVGRHPQRRDTTLAQGGQQRRS